MTKIRRPQIAADQRRSLAALFQRLQFLVRTMSHELGKELRRLNSGRMGRIELSQLAPRDRVCAVKAALAAHHKGTSRCC